MSAKVISRDGYNRLIDELKNIREVLLPEVLGRLKDAIEAGDISESNAYEQAREDRDLLEARINELEKLLENVEIVDEVVAGDMAKYGSTVTIQEKGKSETQTFKLVGTGEIDLGLEKISLESPLGSALNGKKVGDIVRVRAPQGRLEFEIISIQ